MRMLTRYVLIELTKVFVVALVSLTGMMLLVGVVRQAIDEGLGPTQIVRLLPYLLPEALQLSIPGTTLFAVTSVFGRMAASNEVVAVKSMGINPLVLLSPAIVASFLLSLASVWINEATINWGRNGARQVLIEAAEEVAYSMLRTHRSYSNRQFTITVKGVQGRTLVNPTVIFSAGAGGPPVTVTAEEAEIERDLEVEGLRFTLRRGTATGPGLSYHFDYEQREVTLLSASKTPSPSRMALRDLPADRVEQKMQLAVWRQQTALFAAHRMLAGEFDDLGDPHLRFRLDHLRGLEGRIHRLNTEPWRRWASGFSCFCFVMIGAPLSIRFRNAHFLWSFALCFLPMLVVYYPLLMATLDQCKSGRLPPVSVWAGNLILLVWSWHLLRKVARY